MTEPIAPPPPPPSPNPTFSQIIAGLTPGKRWGMLALVWFGIPLGMVLLEILFTPAKYAQDGFQLWGIGGGIFTLTPLMLWFRIGLFLCMIIQPAATALDFFAFIGIAIEIAIIALSVRFLIRPRAYLLYILAGFFCVISYRAIWHFVLLAGASC